MVVTEVLLLGVVIFDLMLAGSDKTNAQACVGTDLLPRFAGELLLFHLFRLRTFARIILVYCFEGC
jgi:hypothetical protein